MRHSTQQKMFKGIDRWKQGGLSQKAWCEKNNVSYATFHYWYRKYREANLPLSADTDGFVQLLVNDSVTRDCWCELSMADGRKLVFHQGVTADFLKTLIS